MLALCSLFSFNYILAHMYYIDLKSHVQSSVCSFIRSFTRSLVHRTWSRFNFALVHTDTRTQFTCVSLRVSILVWAQTKMYGIGTGWLARLPVSVVCHCYDYLPFDSINLSRMNKQTNVEIYEFIFTLVFTRARAYTHTHINMILILMGTAVHGHHRPQTDRNE